MIDLFMARDSVEDYFARNQCQWVRYPPAIIPGIIRQMRKTEKPRKEKDRGEKGERIDGIVSSVGK